jgi:Tfp pilus assembly protein PilE
LIELVVTCLVIGVLSSFAVPQYLSTIENGKADDAVALVNMIGTTNKMFALDHGGFYVSGQFPASTCGSAGVCPANVAAAVTNAACTLVFCKYLADQDFSGKAYTYYACDPGTGAGGGNCAATYVAGAHRLASAYAPYNGWYYLMNSGGTITANGGAAPPTY